MSLLVADCPRCRAQEITFDVLSAVITGRQYDWQAHWELFCSCARCKKTTVFVTELSEPTFKGLGDHPGNIVGVGGAINRFVRNKGYISNKDKATTPAPEFLPPNIKAAFDEGAKCLAIGCFNAAGTMFRLCVDMTTKDKMPEGDVVGLNHRTRRDLGLRLPWLFDNRYLPEDLRDLSHCIKEDGNDGAHQGTLSEADALDLLDFTEALLKRVYTEPERLRLAKERRDQRRAG